MDRRPLILLLSLLLALPVGARGGDDPLTAQRERFRQAYAALERGQEARARRLARGLEDYPLYPYLEERRLRRQGSGASDAEIRTFLDRWPDGPLAERLRRSWLKRLARQKAWPRFLAFYREPQSAELQCYRLQALLARQPPDADWLQHARRQWLVGRSQPDSCDPVFKVLLASPAMSSELIWQRIELAIDNGKLSLARWLGGKLSAADRRWVERWRAAHRRPARTLRDPALAKDNPLVRKILVHALQRLARSDPPSARAHWQRLRQRHAFSPAQRAAVQRSIALHAAYRYLPEARAWLDSIPAEARDRRSREWRARTALQAADWPDLLAAILAMPEEERNATEWRWWRAVALENSGRADQARSLFATLAGERHYYGFLAADRLQQDYRLGHRAISADRAALDALLAIHPGLLRAGELYRLEMRLAARREWRHASAALTPRQLELAAALAHRWGWHDQAIATAARSRHRDDLELRFPLVYTAQVEQTARRFKLDPAWIFGVMRQESAFKADARSPAGALGLMQLMPATGRHTARLLRLPRPTTATLLQAGANIRLGSGYLKRVLERFAGNEVLATAAYNAGPLRVQRWLPKTDGMPAARWVDTLPYRETRGYVRGVLAFTTVYDLRLDGGARPLSSRMPEIPAREPRGDT
ncbi:transglycosylase SLT domain-containing protein [Thiohalobacter sp. IOR34]|uniref:transglycosylase SLT domain-containing protein n=1 Tax=Thiohalobacter sp. IOR34 TaxID=3057176 RepID=UPI0025B12D94|nr:transglycosylase SLT domain-containing protein [Thiohalobacter sp. IOR34]WJW75366.1 transglycosylase SLT domain-containing protein [Thiohalobacter sp. IOR34]